MDDRGMSLLRQLISDVEGAPFPSTVHEELYAIWYEHAQSVAQETLKYLNTIDPNFGRVNDIPADFS